MRRSGQRAVSRVVFDDPNLIDTAGLVPTMALAQKAHLAELADHHTSIPTDKGANAGAKIFSLVAGMVAGADSIDDMALLRHSAMPKILERPYAPSTLGSFLRSFTFGHVRQLDAVASRFLDGLAAHTQVLEGIDDQILVDIDDTIIEVHGHGKQGAGFGYTGTRGLNTLIATVTTTRTAPVIAAQRLRKGSCGSSRGAARIVADTLATVRRLRDPEGLSGRVLVRADSAFYGFPTVSAAINGGAEVSVTVRLDPKVRSAIAQIPDDAWTPIKYTDAIYDEQTRRWVSRAEVAEIPFTAFTSRKATDHIQGRLIVRRIPDLNTTASQPQAALFDTWRFHAFFTTTDPKQVDTVAADQTHRQHAIIEQVHADLKNSALAHLPSGRFTANSAWLVLAAMSFNLTRAAASIAGGAFARATTATVRRTLINISARIASSGRRLTLHLPHGWPWQAVWTRLFARICGPPDSTAT
ncbi:IS1380 family transposase [Nocardia gamkensis]|uniref:IS1380 family transposase n=1 Tax=Nocardia gamkensis TaxID=352869 RepID=UPI0036EA2821